MRIFMKVGHFPQRLKLADRPITILGTPTCRQVAKEETRIVEVEEKTLSRGGRKTHQRIYQVKWMRLAMIFQVNSRISWSSLGNLRISNPISHRLKFDRIYRRVGRLPKMRIIAIIVIMRVRFSLRIHICIYRSRLRIKLVPVLVIRSLLSRLIASLFLRIRSMPLLKKITTNLSCPHRQSQPMKDAYKPNKWPTTQCFN